MGVPAPAGAGLVLLPIFCNIQFPELAPIVTNPTCISVYTIFIGYLLVSRIPTFSSKMMTKAGIKNMSLLAKILLFGTLFITFGVAISNLNLGIIVADILYLCSFPVSYGTFILQKERKTH